MSVSPVPLAAIPAPSTPLGPFEDSAVTWTTWVTLMGFVGLVTLAVVVSTAARRAGGGSGVDALTPVTVRLARAAALLGVLAVPAVLADLAHGASESGGYAWGTAWNSLFDGTGAGRLAGLEVTLVALAAVLVLPLAARRVATGRRRPWLLGSALAAGAVALGTTKFPDAIPEDWGRTSFETGMWMLHLLGGAVWAGGLFGLLLLALPGGVPAEARAAFWSPAVRRFSVAAMSCVGAIALSGVFLYWEHVDGPGQLFTTMYGRVLGVKIVVFGALLALGAVNQFVLHPRIEALRAAGDERPLRTLLAREFPAAVGAEVFLVLAVLMIAPFLHGSARNQAFQAQAAKDATSTTQELPRIADKQVSSSTWVWGSLETVAVVAVMVGGYRVSGTVARRRRTPALA